MRSHDDTGTVGIDIELARKRVAQRLRRTVTDARKQGLVLVIDAAAIGVRVITTKELDDASDLRRVGELVPFDEGCGCGYAFVNDSERVTQQVKAS